MTDHDDAPWPVTDLDRIPHPRRHRDDTRLRHYANLLAAVRAAVAAEREGEDDPLWYLRDELAAQDAATGGHR